MHRRDFLKKAALVSGLAALQPWQLVKMLGVRDEQSARLQLGEWDLSAEAQTYHTGTIPGAINFGDRKIIWDSMVYTGMPDLWELYRMPKLPLFKRQYSFGWETTWVDELTVPNDPGWYDQAASYILGGQGNTYQQRAQQGWLHLDHEVFPGCNPFSSTQAERLQAAADFVTIHTELKARMPNQKIGIYTWPLTRTTAPLDFMPGNANYTFWQAGHEDFAAMYPVADAFFPSFYMPYSRGIDGPGPVSKLRYYITNMIHEQRRLIEKYGNGQKIYPFVTYRRQNDAADLDFDVWYELFLLIYQLGDGIVIFSGDTTAWSTASALPWWSKVVEPFLLANRFPMERSRTF